MNEQERQEWHDRMKAECGMSENAYKSIEMFEHAVAIVTESKWKRAAKFVGKALLFLFVANWVLTLILYVCWWATKA